MRRFVRAGIIVPVLALLTGAGREVAAQAPAVPAAVGRHTAADTRFMQGMIGHHAQAMVMAAMAPSHGASPQVALFARKIFQSQRDEIELMQTWLRDHGERAPDASDPHAGMDMSMPGHMMLMPGMLTPEQLAQLDAARGVAFDRLFLTFMIQHHRGALTMVAELFAAPGSGQEPELFGYATGVDADQRAEIERMERMLAAL
ncbi:MAG: hypothetical protein JWN79_1899 [Gemmatimonadetes bacterium]|nr:hypothetical protein [Gemmatimonadota bacterium]